MAMAMAISNPNSTLLAVSIATAFSGLCAGAMSFVSFVDCRSFVDHLQKQNTDLVVAHFQVWWPNGRDLMVPLIGCNIVSHAAAWVLTRDKVWIVSAACLGMIGPYTKIVLGEDIQALRSSSKAEVDITAKRFCKLHHARLAMASAGFFLALFGMGQQFEGKSQRK
jgi:hypothetical protein